MFEIFVCMFKEEWRMHSTLFGNLNFALFPILIFGMAFMGAFLIPFTARLMDVSMLVVTTHSMYCIMGFMVGSSLPLKFSILQAALIILFCCAPFFPDWEITNIAFLILGYVIASSAIAMPFLWTGVYVLTRQCRANPLFCIAAFVFWGNVFLQCFFSFYGTGILTDGYP